MCAFKAALQGREVTRADSTTWSLEEDIPPLLITAGHSCVGASQMLLDAGTRRECDLQQQSMLAASRPLCSCSNAGMTRLLERGASRTVATFLGTTIAHVLAPRAATPSIDVAAAAAAEFRLRWLRCDAAAPSL
jgi:hypothetical protein